MWEKIYWVGRLETSSSFKHLQSEKRKIFPAIDEVVESNMIFFVFVLGLAKL